MRVVGPGYYSAWFYEGNCKSGEKVLIREEKRKGEREERKKGKREEGRKGGKKKEKGRKREKEAKKKRERKKEKIGRAHV